MHRFFRASLTATAAAALMTVASAPTVDAVTATTKLEAESGQVVDVNCGADGPAGVQSGGTGSVVFLPADGCQIRFSGATLRRRPARIVFSMSGATSGCGRFYVSGGFQGTSSFGCVYNGTVSVPVGATIGDGGADVILEWDVYSGSPDLNAHVDYVTLSAIEAEEGSIVNSLCGADGPMRVQGTGPDAVVMYPATGCAQTFPKESARPTGMMFATEATGCGHFEFTGAYVGVTQSHCGTTPGWRPATLLDGVGTTYTVTWRRDGVGGTADNAYLNYLSHA